MASVRFIKKCVKSLTNDLMAEGVIYRHYHADKNLDKANGVMEKIVKKHHDLIGKINKADKTDYKKNKAHFKEIVTEMKQMVTILDGLE